MLNPRLLPLAKWGDAGFDESKIQRDQDGKFSEKAGGGAPSSSARIRAATDKMKQIHDEATAAPKMTAKERWHSRHEKRGRITGAARGAVRGAGAGAAVGAAGGAAVGARYGRVGAAAGAIGGGLSGARIGAMGGGAYGAVYPGYRKKKQKSGGYDYAGEAGLSAREKNLRRAQAAWDQRQARKATAFDDFGGRALRKWGDAGFDESKVSRDDDGKFSSKGGGGGYDYAGEAGMSAKEKNQRRAAAAVEQFRQKKESPKRSGNRFIRFGGGPKESLSQKQERLNAGFNQKSRKLSAERAARGQKDTTVSEIQARQAPKIKRERDARAKGAPSPAAIERHARQAQQGATIFGGMGAAGVAAMAAGSGAGRRGAAIGGAVGGLAGAAYGAFHPAAGTIRRANLSQN